VKSWLINGDCRDVLPSLGDSSVDCVISDPPYPEVNRPYGKMTEAEWLEMMRGVVPQLMRVLKPTGSAVFVLKPNSERVGRMRTWLLEFMLWVAREYGIVQDAYWWNHTSPPNVHCHRDIGLMRPSVAVCVWIGPSDCYRNQDAVLWQESMANAAKRNAERLRAVKTEPYTTPGGFMSNMGRAVQAAEDRGGVTPFNLLPIANSNSQSSSGAHGHGAGTPYALCDWWLRYICPSGGVCLDPFSGLATVGRAAIAQGKLYIGIEKNAEYHVTAQRLVDEALDAATPPGYDK